MLSSLQLFVAQALTRRAALAAAAIWFVGERGWAVLVNWGSSGSFGCALCAALRMTVLSPGLVVVEGVGSSGCALRSG